MSGKRKYPIDAGELYRLYWIEKLSIREIAPILKCHPKTLPYYFRYLNVPVRSLSESIQLAYDRGILDHKGSKASKWRGGRSIDKRGYVTVYVDPISPYHVMCRRGRNSVDEHRLVMAQHLKRPLLGYEIVHHINGVKGDNRIENLELMSASDHSPISRKCIGCKAKLELRKAITRVKELETLLQQKLSL